MHKEMKMLTAGKWNQLKARQRDIEKVPEREGEEGNEGRGVMKAWLDCVPAPESRPIQHH